MEYFGPPCGSYGGNGWENKAYSIVEEQIGKSEFGRRIAKQFEDGLTRPGIFSGLQLSWRSSKIRRLFGLDTIKTHSSNNLLSVGAAGFAVVSKDLEIGLENEIFKPGHVFQVRLRHCNVFSDDDARSDIRMVALKFCDEDTGGPFDLVMTTGRAPLFFNMAGLEDFDKAVGKNGAAKRQWLYRFPINYWTTVDSERRVPLSYYGLRYYSHMTYTLKSKDGMNRLVRFRMVPADPDIQESGLLSEQHQKQVWLQERHAEDCHAEDYLKAEYAERLVKERCLRYKLQIQYHVVTDHDLDNIYNACEFWDPEHHPWIDMCDIIMTAPLPPEVTSRMVFDVNNMPAILSLSEAQSIYDFKSGNHAMVMFYVLHQKQLSKRKFEDKNRHNITYMIGVETGGQSGAGTHANVQLTLNGFNGRTDRHSLNNIYLASGVSVYKFEDSSVGPLLTLQVDVNQRVVTNDWFLKRMVITCLDTNQTYVFPCNQWATGEADRFLLKTDQVCIMQKEPHDQVVLTRIWQLQNRKKMCSWRIDGKAVKNKTVNSTFQNLPGQIQANDHKSLPKDLQLPEETVRAFWRRWKEGFSNLQMGAVETLFGRWTDLKDCKAMTMNLGDRTSAMMYLVEHWKDDECFGNQVLNGPYPAQIRNVASLPFNIPVTDHMLSGCLDRGLSLTEEIQEGHVFIVDFPEIDSLTHYSDRFIAQPMCLLYLRSDEKLVPIAIRLTTDPHTNAPTWTPNDNPEEWLLAKIWVHWANYQYHQILGPLFNRVILEPVAVSSLRNLSASHPVGILLQYHLRNVVGIRCMDREFLPGIYDEYLGIGGGGEEDLLKRAYSRFTFKIMNVPVDMKSRGVEDPELLPGYFYRDDALALWNSIMKFIHGLVHVYYSTDEEVKEDREIQSWVADCYENGFLAWENNIDHGFPCHIDCRHELVDVLTAIVFASTTQHAALNNPQYDYYAFIPNMPPTMNKPPPTEKGTITMDMVMESLPSKRQSAFSVAASYLQTRATSEFHLGTYSTQYPQAQIQEVLDEFRKDLEIATKKIEERNLNLDIPYAYLLPEKVPTCVSI